MNTSSWWKLCYSKKVIDRNLIYNHNIFVCQELICSGIHLRRKVKSRPIPDCKSQWQSNIKSYHDTIARWKPMHWIWLWATFKKNNQTTINAPTNTPFVQKYANYNSTGNRTTTSSHLNSGLRIWTEKMKWVQESLTKLLAKYIPKKSVHRFADFYFGAIAFYFKLLMWSKMRPLVHKVRFCYHSHSHLH